MRPLVVIVLLISGLVQAQVVVLAPQTTPAPSVSVTGQIVLYNSWLMRLTRAEGDMFLKVDGENSFVHLLYRAYGVGAFDAPAPSPDQIIPPEMIGDGNSHWTFRGHAPRDDFERKLCTTLQQVAIPDGKVRYRYVEHPEFYIRVEHATSVPPDLHATACMIVSAWSVAENEPSP